MIEGYSVIDGYAIKVLAIGPIIFDYLCNVLRVPLQLPVLLRGSGGLAEAGRAQWKHALVVSTLGPLAYICMLYASTQALLSHVAPARELSMLWPRSSAAICSANATVAWAGLELAALQAGGWRWPGAEGAPQH